MQLYVVFAFAPKQQAVVRVQLQALLPGGSYDGPIIDVPLLLSKFALPSAHCYDPNEEFKIRGIIRECGQESFESHIRELGTALQNKSTVEPET